MKRSKNAIYAGILLLGWLVLPSLSSAQNPTEQDIPPGASSPSASADQASPDQTVQNDSSQGAAPDTDVTPTDQDSSKDPPGRVARLQYMTGSVSIQPRGVDDWVQGSINRPLTTSDNIWADKNSRAELGLGNSVLRIGSETSLTMTNINDNVVQLQLHQGTLNVFVRKLFSGETYEVDTPNQAFTIRKAGDYRFDVETTGDVTLVTVRRGEGESTGQGQTVRITEGKQVRFTGTALAHTEQGAPAPDDFDQWAQTRDQRVIHSSASSRYVGPGMVGGDDLDQYGTWKDEPDYGPVWTPTSVDPGWAPYRYGHWVWISPWGWTWVDDAPWGFAPFHYGRWNYFGTYWGWIPGPYYARPIWAPALVGWYGGYGWGWGWGFGFGWGWGGVGFGWCPLGWREPFYPWYRGSRFYFRNVNISNTRITNINRVTNNFYNHTPGHAVALNHVNMTRPGGFTAAPKSTLTNSSPVNKTMARVPASAMKNTPSLNRPNVAPTRNSVLGANAGKPAAAAPRSVASRPTVSRMTPPAAPTRASSSTSSMQSARVSQTSRGPENMSANRGVTNTARPPERSATTTPGRVGQTAPSHYVPRPPSAGGMPTARNGASSGTAAGRSEPTQMAMNHPSSVPRPTAGSTPRPSEGSVSNSGRGMAGNSGYSHNVPRPTGEVRPAPQQYSSRPYGGGGYGSSRGYQSRGYGDYERYSGRNYGGGYSGRSYGGGSYGGGGYHSGSGSSHGSYGGGGGYHGGGGGGGHSSGGGGSHSGGGHR